MLITAGLHRRAQRGLSLVELMVGMAIGLLVVAGAALVVSTQLVESRRLLTETQIQQDLRAAADIVTRELRRAGSWARGDNARDTVNKLGVVGLVNPFTTLSISSLGTDRDQVTYQYDRNANSLTLQYGFQLDGAGVLRYNIDGNGWQELTDSRTMRVTKFTVTPRNGASFTLPCNNTCTGGGTACWPKLTVRELVVDIEAVAANDPNVTRRLQTVARLRNDQFLPGTGGPVCP